MRTNELCREIEKAFLRTRTGKPVQISRDVTLKIIGKLALLEAYEKGELSREQRTPDGH